ncbi:MAG TPA: AI-2E family transporter [Bacteroidota bacterium]|nr:AI-2E family transporter [Bacteroidota bacterium]
MNEERASGAVRLFVVGACTVILIAGMKAAADLLNTFLLSTLLALAILPLPTWLLRKGISKGVSIAITLSLVVIGGLAVLSLLGSSIASLVNTLPSYAARLTSMRADVEAFLIPRGIDPAKLLPEDTFAPSHLLNIAEAFLSGVAGTLSSALILIVLSVLILVEFVGAPETSTPASGTTQMVIARFEAHLNEVRKYISITGWMGLITAAADYILLLAVGVDFAITWAVLSFFLSFIPNIGVFLSLILPALLAFFAHGWIAAIVIVGGYLLISVIVGSLVAPRLMAKGLELKFLHIVASLLFWTWVLGAPGAILAVPLTVVVKKFIVEWIRREAA